ncbi:MAG: zinc-dependent metalloprotease [Cyclobacteriaceae bacterium]|nr:zinc-dependent metalloprotease [Cyclobacteriaceae bacterium]
MKKSFWFVLSFLLFCINAYSQILSNPITLNANYVEDLRNEFRDFNTIRIDIERLNEICKTEKGRVSFQMFVGSTRNWHLILEENEIRAPKHQISLNNESTDTHFGICTTYKGHLKDNPNNIIRLSIAGGIIEGYIMDGNEMMFIKPVSKIIKNYSNTEHFVIFNLNDVIDDPNIEDCGTEDVKVIRDVIQNNENFETARATTSCRVLEIATEADFEFFQENSSDVTTSNNNILGILNQVEGVYQTTFNVRFLVVFQSVWSVSGDPYSAVGSGDVVDELASWWQSNRGNVGRDIVYFFSAKTGHTVKGAAKVIGAICDNIANSYAFTATEVTNELAITTAHEIGHLFNAVHPNTTNPASCSPDRTIMCTDPSNLGRVLQFSAFSQDEINAWINGHNTCLTDVLNVSISGENFICSTEQFTVTGLPPNSSITSWQSSNSYALTVASNGLATRQNSYNGLVNITASGNYGNDGCTFVSSPKMVWVGQPVVDYISFANPVNESPYFCSSHYDNTINIMSDSTYTTPTTFEARLLDLNLSVYYTSTVPYSHDVDEIWYVSPTPANGYYIFEVRGTNGCGTTGWYGTEVEYVDCSQMRYMVTYPNPTSDKLTIERISKRETTKVQPVTEYKLYNMNQELVSIGTVSKSLTLDVSAFKNGMYILVLTIGEKIETHRILIE